MKTRTRDTGGFIYLSGSGGGASASAAYARALRDDSLAGEKTERCGDSNR